MGNLVLTRRPGESIVIEIDGEKLIEIGYVSHSGEAIRVSLAAADNVKIYRDEIYEKVLRERINQLKKQEC